MTGRTYTDLQAPNSGSFDQLNQRDWGGATRTLNLEGMAVHRGIRPEHGCRATLTYFSQPAIAAESHSWIMGGLIFKSL